MIMLVCKILHVHVGFDHSSLHSTMIFTVNSMTTLMDNAEQARARLYVYVSVFFAVLYTRVSTRVYAAGGRGRSPVQRVQANGTKVDCDYTCVSAHTRADLCLHVRYT